MYSSESCKQTLQWLSVHNEAANFLKMAHKFLSWLFLTMKYEFSFRNSTAESSLSASSTSFTAKQLTL